MSAPDRPTREQVDAALVVADDDAPSSLSIWPAMDALAAEVRALRAELDASAARIEWGVRLPGDDVNDRGGIAAQSENSARRDAAKYAHLGAVLVARRNSDPGPWVEPSVLDRAALVARTPKPAESVPDELDRLRRRDAVVSSYLEREHGGTRTWAETWRDLFAELDEVDRKSSAPLPAVPPEGADFVTDPARDRAFEVVHAGLMAVHGGLLDDLEDQLLFAGAAVDALAAHPYVLRALAATTWPAVPDGLHEAVVGAARDLVGHTDRMLSDWSEMGPREGMSAEEYEQATALRDRVLWAPLHHKADTLRQALDALPAVPDAEARQDDAEHLPAWASVELTDLRRWKREHHGINCPHGHHTVFQDVVGDPNDESWTCAHCYLRARPAVPDGPTALVLAAEQACAAIKQLNPDATEGAPIWDDGSGGDHVPDEVRRLFEAGDALMREIDRATAPAVPNREDVPARLDAELHDRFVETIADHYDDGDGERQHRLAVDLVAAVAAALAREVQS